MNEEILGNTNKFAEIYNTCDFEDFSFLIHPRKIKKLYLHSKLRGSFNVFQFASIFDKSERKSREIIRYYDSFGVIQKVSNTSYPILFTFTHDYIKFIEIQEKRLREVCSNENRISNSLFL